VLQIITVPVPAGGGRVTLDLTIPVAGKYSIGAAPQGMYRNLNGADFPYSVDSIASIYLSSFVANPKGAYFYLYDWELNYCFSDPAPVSVAITPGPVAAFEPTVNDLQVNFDNNTTGTYIAVSWDFGDGNTEAGIVNPSHTYNAPGVYTVVLTVTDGNCTTTYEEQVHVGLTGNSDFSQVFGLEIYPNPTFDRAFISSKQPISGPVLIELTDASGRVVLQRTSVQTFSIEAIDTEKFAAGVYQLRLIAREGSAVFKLTIAK
jgi:PKD repeat protein